MNGRMWLPRLRGNQDKAVFICTDYYMAWTISVCSCPSCGTLRYENHRICGSPLSHTGGGKGGKKALVKILAGL